jgi:hypothetical protein
MQITLSEIDINAVRNIASEAAEILHSAVHVAGRILSRRVAMDAAGKGDALLYVLAGETHLNPCEYLHHVLLLEALKQGADSQSAVICGVEVEHDYYEKDCFDGVPPKGSDKYLYNSFGYAADCYDGGGAAYGRKTLFTYLAQHKPSKSIMPIFNDASCSPFDELELSIKGSVIDATEDDGMRIRNKVM